MPVHKTTHSKSNLPKITKKIIMTRLIVKLKIWAGPLAGVYAFCLLKRLLHKKSFLQKKLLLQVLLQNWKFEQGLRRGYPFGLLKRLLQKKVITICFKLLRVLLQNWKFEQGLRRGVYTFRLLKSKNKKIIIKSLITQVVPRVGRPTVRLAVTKQTVMKKECYYEVW